MQPQSLSCTLHARTFAVLRCPSCRGTLAPHDTGARCEACATQYPAIDGILDLRAGGFDAHKQRQEEFFSAEAEGYERDVVNSRFYQALDALTVGRWAQRLPPQSRVVDIGSGTGRVAITLAKHGHDVIAVDLTPALLRRAREKALAAGIVERIDFVLADAETLPIADAAADGAVAHGVLHHVEQPALLIAEAARVLRPGGAWFSLDPHRSPARAIFDAAMRRHTLWQEDAAPDALQTEDRLRGWLDAAGIDPAFGYSVYMLPHLLSPWPRSIIAFLLAATDAVFRRSFMRRLAGVIYVVGTRRPATAAAATSRWRHAALPAVLIVMAAISGVWRADPAVAARSAQYYMGGLPSMVDQAAAASRYRTTFIFSHGEPLEEGLDDVGYIVALQLASVAGVHVTAERLAQWHAVAYAIVSVLFAWSIGWRFRSSVAAIASLVVLLVLGSRLSMLIYGQVSNQSATSLFPPVVLACLVVGTARLADGPTRRGFVWIASFGALVGVIDLIRHSHGLAVMLAVACLIAAAVRGVGARVGVAAALLVGYILMTVVVPAALKVQRDIVLNRWTGWHWSYLERPPAHHIWYTLLTAVGRYPNALGLYYEDHSVDTYIEREAPSARGEQARVNAARALFANYVRTHPAEYLQTLSRGAGELGPFVAYVTFMAPKRWEYGWPSIVPGLQVEGRDIARYGMGLLMNVRARYLRLTFVQWTLIGAAALALIGGAVSAVASWRSRRDIALLLAAALLYLAWVALPRGLIPVQGMDFVVAFWCVALLCAVHLLAGGDPAPLHGTRALTAD